ncbi:hypothetical protein KCP73_15190 [Salmonella enterica subsp. enterica]|nr:hypothetical protein KCP73_15190 [Salmonella enterica subsp. enterica]
MSHHSPGSRHTLPLSAQTPQYNAKPNANRRRIGGRHFPSRQQIGGAPMDMRGDRR